jgi:predicted permease
MARFGGALNKRRKDRELDDEIESHLQLHAEDNLRSGMTPEEARRQAVIKLGGIEPAKEAYRDQRGVTWLENFSRDLHFGARQLRKNPGFTAVAALTLALGIGANTAIFSVVYGVLLKPLSFVKPEQLVRVFESAEGAPRFPMTAGDFLDYREQNQTLSALALYTQNNLELSKDEKPELLAAMRVSSDFFAVLGVRPLLGRDFQRDDESQGRHHVVILSNNLWRRRFNGDPAVVGQKVTLAGEPFTVVGVMPPGVQHVGGDYRSTAYGETVELWFPLFFQPNDDRSMHYLNAVGRLKPGVPAERAAADLNVIARRLALQFPATNGGSRIAVQSLHEAVVGRTRAMLLVLFGAVLSVLLIACVNVANLLMARAAARERELAVRSAVGAGKWRIIRQLLTESLLLAGLGAAAGVALAKCGLILLVKFGPDQLPRLQTVQLDGHVLLFTLGMALLTGLLFGLAPAWQAGKTNVNSMLKEGGRNGAGGPRQSLRDILVASEVALALLLLVGTGLLVRSFWRLQQTDAGFNPARVLTAAVSLPYESYNNNTNVVRFQSQLLERIGSLAGVESAGLTSDLPWTGYDENSWFEIEGKTFPPNKGPGGRYHFVSSDYFRAVGAPLVAGRFFNRGDRLDTPGVVLINRCLAERYWPGENPVGQRITFIANPKERDWRTVAGVVGDVKDRPDAAAAVPAFYLCLAQSPIRQALLALRTTAEPSTMAAAARGVIHDLDPDVPVAQMKTLETIADSAIAGRRFTFWLAGCFAAMALGLAAIGIYGVLSYLVAQRRREIGVRMALGAQAGDIVKLTLAQGMRPALLGLLLGLAGALAMTRLMSSVLFGVSATDPGTFTVCSLALLAAALPPCWLPARRAGRVDPMAALRYE